jgi:large subunit ribosomal protein L1
MKINLKQSKGGDFNLRTVIKLPQGSGKKTKIAVLCEAEKIEEAKKSGADIFGSDDLIEQISSGKFNFNKLICTPPMMGKLGKHGKILGPKGLMPNPKLGTVATDIKKAVEDIKTGLVEVKNDKDGNVASTIGRKSFSNENLLSNFNYFVDSIKKEKPDTMKGELIKNIYITSSMGISYKVGSKR